MKIKALIVLGLTIMVCPGCVMAVMAAARAAKPKKPDTLLQALDTNHDGVIDATELANAPAALATLDRNHDGKLTEDEIKASRR